MNYCTTCGVAFDVGYRSCKETGCKVFVLERQRKPYMKKPVDPIYTRFMATKRRSYLKGWDYDLTVDFIRNLLNSFCVYCGGMDSLQLDRKDNAVGYVQTNVVPACKRCNTVKSMYLSYDQMMTVAKALGWSKV